MAFSTSPVNQSTAVYSAGTSVAISVSAATTNNMTAVHWGGAQNSINVSSLSQTNVTWNGSADANSKTNRGDELWSGIATGTGGLTCTVNLSGTPSLGSVNYTEWSGNDTSSFRGPGAAGAGTSTTPTTGSVTPTSGREVLIIAGSRIPSNYSSGPTMATGSVSTGPTRLTQGDTRTETAFAIVNSASGGGYSITWTCASSSVWDCTIATYYAPSGGGGFAPSDDPWIVAPPPFDPSLVVLWS